MSNLDKEFELLQRLMNLVKGKTDIKKRIEILLRPDKPQTSSKITLPQVSYVQDAFWLASVYPEFEPLKEDAIQLLQTMLSHDGFGIKSTIDLQKALTHGEKETLIQKETLPQKIKRTVKGEQIKQ